MINETKAIMDVMLILDNGTATKKEKLKVLEMVSKMYLLRLNSSKTKGTRLE